MIKPKSLRWAFSKRQRQQYKSVKGIAFPRCKVKKFPTLNEMYTRISAFEKKGFNKNVKGEFDYFISILFSPKIHQNLARIGWEYPKQSRVGIHDYETKINSLIKRVKNCDESELNTIKKSIQAIRKEIVLANNHINRETFTLNALSKDSASAALVRHNFFNVVFGIEGYIKNYVEYAIEQRAQTKK